MAHQINPHQQKLAEKLTILNDRGIGMLTRIFNIKKVKKEIEELLSNNRLVILKYRITTTVCRKIRTIFVMIRFILMNLFNFRRVMKQNQNRLFFWIKILNLFFVRYKRNFQLLIKYLLSDF